MRLPGNRIKSLRQVADCQQKVAALATQLKVFISSIQHAGRRIFEVCREPGLLVLPDSILYAKLS